MNRTVLFTLCFGLLYFFSACKKEATVQNNPNVIGTMIGDGSEIQLREVIQTKDGHYLLCGTVLNGEHGASDGFVMKLDKNFNILWNKHIGGSYIDYFYSMALDENENIMLAGNSYSFGVSVDPKNLSSTSLFYMVYLDPNGELIWESTFHPTPSMLNIGNVAVKVLYFKDNTFGIFGETRNNSGMEEVFAYCIAKDKTIKWTKRFNRPYSKFDTYCQNACLTDDGNIIFQSRSDTSDAFGSRVASITLLKTGKVSSGYSVNNTQWKGANLLNILTVVQIPFNVNDFYNQIPMCSCGGDRVALADFIHKGIVLTNDRGEITKSIVFNYPLLPANMYRRGKEIVINGMYETENGLKPAFIVTDFDGQIIQETILAKQEAFPSDLDITSILTNDQQEFILFGSIDTKKGNNMVVIKFDTMGNLIKE